MSAPVSVVGGSTGIAASVEDLFEIAAGLRTLHVAAADLADEVGGPLVGSALDTGQARDPLGAAALFDSAATVRAALAAGAEQTSRLGLLVFLAAERYRDTDDWLAGLVGRLLDGVELFDPAASAGSVTSAVAAVAQPLLDVAAVLDPDGHAVLHDLGTDTRPVATSAPRSLDELITGLALRNTGLPGEISVSFVVGADGVRRAIVDIPGTKSWSPVPNSDVTSVGTDVRAMVGLRTAYEDGVLDAMAAAGVGPDEPVLLVGHSEGGMVAVDAARDAVREHRFRITHVVTAGSPIGRIAGGLPESVGVLALENDADLVPAADGSRNPDRPNVTTVTVHEPRGSLVADHDLVGSYLPAAVTAEHCCNQSIDDFLAGARHFLDGGAMRTHAYLVTRGFR